MAPLLAHLPRRPRPALVALAVVALAAASLAWSAEPGFDPQGWVNWGHELLAGSFRTVGYPSWKPLPLLVTAPLALTGPAAPTLWLLIARSAALLAVVLAGVLARRLAGPTAAAVAAVALLLAGHYLEVAASGLIEPVVLALVLGACLRHLDGHRGQALALGTLAALGRLEVWPLLVLYALWWVVREPRAVRWMAPALLAPPVLWFGGDWLGSGSPWHGGWLARQAGAAVAARHSGHPALFVGQQALHLLPTVALVLAGIGLVWALVRPRGAALAVAALALAWVAEDVVLGTLGYAGEEGRFLLPAAGLVAVIAGAGAEAVAGTLSRAGGRVLRPAIPVAAVAALVAAQAGTVGVQVGHWEGDGAVAQALDAVSVRIRDRPALRAARNVVVYPQLLQTRLAWDLGRSNEVVERPLPGGVVLAIPGSPTWRWFVGPCARRAARPVARLGRWEALHLPRAARRHHARRVRRRHAARCRRHRRRRLRVGPRRVVT